MSKIDPLDLDPEEAKWFHAKEKAKARREASRVVAPQLQPPVITEAEWDAQRAAQAKKDQDRIKAADISPSDLAGGGDPFDLDMAVHRPAPNQEVVIVPAGIPTPTAGQSPATIFVEISFWTCDVFIEAEELHHTIYATSWEDMKTRLTKHAGSWKAIEHKFPNTIGNILGFFVPLQHTKPSNTVQKTFDIIVQGGKVFRSES